MQKNNNTLRTKISKQEAVNGAWNFAYSLLWNNKHFNEAEIKLAKQLIQEMFEQTDKPLATFIMFCERVQLTFQYLKKNEARFVPHPLKWLSPHFEYGYIGTENWYLDMVHERLYIPIHRFELRVVAEAYLQFVGNATKENYQAGKKAIQHYNTTDLLQAFDNAVLNFKYNN
jgi:hypothetical protein